MVFLGRSGMCRRRICITVLAGGGVIHSLCGVYSQEVHSHRVRPFRNLKPLQALELSSSCRSQFTRLQSSPARPSC